MSDAWESLGGASGDAWERLQSAQPMTTYVLATAAGITSQSLAADISVSELAADVRRPLLSAVVTAASLASGIEGL